MIKQEYAIRSSIGWPYFWSRKLEIFRNKAYLGYIRYHAKKHGIKNTVSLDWIEVPGHPLAAKTLYQYFEELIKWKGYKRIEALCHDYSLKIAFKIGYIPDNRVRNDLDPSLETVVKELDDY